MTTPSKEATKANKGGFWDLEEQFAFYGQYHTNKVNVAVHIVCVPLIFWSFLVMANKFFPWHTSLPVLLGPIKINAVINFSQFYALAYALYFIGLEPPAGSLYAPFLVFLGWSANEFYRRSNNAMPVAVAVHVACWIAQFIGHGKYEGRAPALFDSLFQSVVLAVFFVFMEVLFAFGYKPQLHRRLQNRIGKEVLAYRQAGKREGKPDDKAVDQQTIFRP